MVDRYFRKPVSFSQYYVLAVKSGSIWCFDCGTWDETEALTLQKQEQSGKAKVLTSPSDDERVIKRLINELNHVRKPRNARRGNIHYYR